MLAPNEDNERKEGSIIEVGSCGFVEHRNAVWIELEKEVFNKNEETLKRSLVGRCGAV